MTADKRKRIIISVSALILLAAVVLLCIIKPWQKSFVYGEYSEDDYRVTVNYGVSSSGTGTRYHDTPENPDFSLLIDAFRINGISKKETEGDAARFERYSSFTGRFDYLRNSFAYSEPMAAENGELTYRIYIESNETEERTGKNLYTEAMVSRYSAPEANGKSADTRFFVYCYDGPYGFQNTVEFRFIALDSGCDPDSATGRLYAYFCGLDEERIRKIAEESAAVTTSQAIEPQKTPGSYYEIVSPYSDARVLRITDMKQVTKVFDYLDGLQMWFTDGIDRIRFDFYIRSETGETFYFRKSESYNNGEAISVISVYQMKDEKWIYSDYSNSKNRAIYSFLDNIYAEAEPVRSQIELEEDKVASVSIFSAEKGFYYRCRSAEEILTAVRFLNNLNVNKKYEKTAADTPDDADLIEVLLQSGKTACIYISDKCFVIAPDGNYYSITEEDIENYEKTLSGLRGGNIDICSYYEIIPGNPDLSARNTAPEDVRKLIGMLRQMVEQGKATNPFGEQSCLVYFGDGMSFRIQKSTLTDRDPTTGEKTETRYLIITLLNGYRINGNQGSQGDRSYIINEGSDAYVYFDEIVRWADFVTGR